MIAPTLGSFINERKIIRRTRTQSENALTMRKLLKIENFTPFSGLVMTEYEEYMYE